MPRRLALDRLLPFRALEPAWLAPIASSAEARAVRRGEVLFWEGEAAAHVWLVESGRVCLVGESGRGLRICVREARPGEVVALPPGLRPGTRHALTARVEEAGTAWRLQAAAVLDAAGRSPAFALDCARLLDRWLGELERRHAALLDPAEDRLAGMLGRLSLGGREAVARSRRELAADIGASEETVFRLLRAFRRKGWVRSDKGLLRVTDPAALRRRDAASL